MDQTKEFLLEEMREGINKVISGELKEYKSEFLPIADFDRYLLELGAEDLEISDSNGWQWDFWAYYKYKNKRYVVSAQGYYGGVSIGLDTDHEDSCEEDEEESPYTNSEED